MSRAPLLLAALLAALTATAHARTVVVAIGNNDGLRHEISLRYAERDAERFGDVMRRLGGVEALDLVEVHGEDAASVRQTLHQLNARIRQGDAADTALVVYYSGHADAAGLHLAGTTLAYDELRDLVTGSPARVRVLVLDGCRSGGLTRVKGARKTVAAFDLDLDHRIEVEGLAIMTSSAANEDSHESERLKGSFFTHHLVAALAGAGDEDGDARVTLSEAYAYAARRTLASSGRTRQLQHPTYAYDIKGRGDFVMTRVTDARGAGRLVLPAPTTYLVRDDDQEGPLRAEVTPERPDTPLALPGGDYFVQARFDDHYDEYSVDLDAGATVALAALEPRRVAYARLVRKGGGGGSAHGLYALGAAHSPVLDGHVVTAGGLLGYGLALEELTVTARARYGRSAAVDGLDGAVDTYAGGLGVERLVDLEHTSLGLGLLAEAVHRRQSLDDARAPTPTSWGFALTVLGLVELPISEQLFVRGEGGVVTQLVRVATIDNGARAGDRLDTRFGGFGALGLGVRL